MEPSIMLPNQEDSKIQDLIIHKPFFVTVEPEELEKCIIPFQKQKNQVFTDFFMKSY